MDVCFCFSRVNGWNGLAGSYGRCRFNFLGHWPLVLKSVCKILHSYEHCMRVPVVPHSHQNLASSVFVIVAILIDLCVLSLRFYFTFTLWPHH